MSDTRDIRCPQENFHKPISDRYNIVAITSGPNRYRCVSCGCEFDWVDTEHWSITKDSPAAAMAKAASSAVLDAYGKLRGIPYMRGK